MTICADLVSEAESYLYATARDPLNKLSTSIDADDETLAFDFELGGIAAGSFVAIDLELFYIWQVSSAPSRQVNVARAQRGSIATNHTAGAMVYVNPKFSKFAMFTAVNADLGDLSAPNNGLFAEGVVTLTYNPAIIGYDLAGVTDLIEVLEVKYDDTGPQKEWPIIRRWELRRDSATSDFSSGLALAIYEDAQPGRPIRVTYSKPFAPFVNLTDDLAVSGLPATASDIPPLGAALRLQSMREGQRNFNESQGDSRRAAEVPVGAQLAGVRGPAGLRMSRIAAERSRLRKKWPYRRRT
jgi:hypothetical protein